MRSLHRYASDAVICCNFYYMFKTSDRYRGFRWFSWVTGVPNLWLIVTLGITGYGRIGAVCSDRLGTANGRHTFTIRLYDGNFVAGEMTDCFFILIEFLHLLGQPLTSFMLWIHVKRFQTKSHREVLR